MPVKGTNKNYIIIANNGNIYSYDRDIATTSTDIADLITEGVAVNIGTMTDAPTRGFFFRNVDDDPKLYFMNGVEFKEWDGTTFQDVDAYIPTVAIG